MTLDNIIEYKEIDIKEFVTKIETIRKNLTKNQYVEISKISPDGTKLTLEIRERTER